MVLHWPWGGLDPWCYTGRREEETHDVTLAVGRSRSMVLHWPWGGVDPWCYTGRGEE